MPAAKKSFTGSITIPMKRKIILVDICAALLLLLLLYAAFSKLLNRPGFEFALAKATLLRPVAHILSWLLPVTEILIGILLFITRTRFIGLIASLVLLSCFTIYLIYMQVFDADKPCSCGGVLEKMNWTQHIFFNLFFIVVALTGIILQKKYYAARHHGPP
jgi:hypothetical protein